MNGGEKISSDETGWGRPLGGRGWVARVRQGEESVSQLGEHIHRDHEGRTCGREGRYGDIGRVAELLRKGRSILNELLINCSIGC